MIMEIIKALRDLSCSELGHLNECFNSISYFNEKLALSFPASLFSALVRFLSSLVLVNSVCACRAQPQPKMLTEFSYLLVVLITRQ